MVEVVPVPDSATVSGLPGALLATDRLPEAAPPAVGVNVTLTVQEAPAASEDPQVFVSANGAPVETEDRLAVAVPVLDTVTVWAALADPTAWLPNDREAGEAVSIGPELFVTDIVTFDTISGVLALVTFSRRSAPAFCAFVELRASELHGGGGPGAGSWAGDCGAVLVGVTCGVVLDGEALSCCGPVRDLDCHVGRGLDRGHRVELQVDVRVPRAALR